METDIAEMLSVSKTPVREALESLADPGLMLSRHKGAVVREVDAKDASAIYDLPILLEPGAVRRASESQADLSTVASVTSSGFTLPSSP